METCPIALELLSDWFLLRSVAHFDAFNVSDLGLLKRLVLDGGKGLDETLRMHLINAQGETSRAWIKFRLRLEE